MRKQDVFLLVLSITGFATLGQPGPNPTATSASKSTPVFAYHKTRIHGAPFHQTLMDGIHKVFLTNNSPTVPNVLGIKAAHVMETDLLVQMEDAQLRTIGKLPQEITHIIIPNLHFKGNKYEVTILIIQRDSIDSERLIIQQSVAPPYFTGILASDDIQSWALGIRQELTYYKRNDWQFKQTWISIDVDAEDPFLRIDIRDQVYTLLSSDLLTTYVDCCGQVPDPKLLHRVQSANISIRISMNGVRKNMGTVKDAINSNNEFLPNKYSTAVLVPLKSYIENH